MRALRAAVDLLAVYIGSEYGNVFDVGGLHREDILAEQHEIGIHALFDAALHMLLKAGVCARLGVAVQRLLHRKGLLGQMGRHGACKVAAGNGALNAAAFLAGKAVGMYSMKDLLAE